MVVSERKHEEMEAKMGRSKRSRYEGIPLMSVHSFTSAWWYTTIDSLDKSGMVVLKLRPASCSRLRQI